METIERSRSSDLVPHEVAARTNITLVGAGAVGSNVAYTLSRMGIGRLRAWDHDIVQEANIEAQVYEGRDLGFNKVDAMRRYLLRETRYEPHHFAWNGEILLDIVDPIIIAGVDTMVSRQSIASVLFENNGWHHYIDGRMGANIIEIYHVTPDELREYYRESITGARPMDLPCSATSVAYNGRLCAAYICRMVAAILKEEPLPYYLKVDLLAWHHLVRLQQ